MALYTTPEAHAANPPDTWQVRKVAKRSWQLVDAAGAVLHTATTKHEAEALKFAGALVALYEKEGRWFAGESVRGWKPYAPKGTGPDMSTETEILAAAEALANLTVGSPTEADFASAEAEVRESIRTTGSHALLLSSREPTREEQP